MDIDFWIICYTILSVLFGGAVARIKGDFISRGMAVAFLTGFFGIIAMLFSPASKARIQNAHDIHNWPAHASFAVFCQLFFGIVLLIVY
jgi:hypothetical protein